MSTEVQVSSNSVWGIENTIKDFSQGVMSAVKQII